MQHYQPFFYFIPLQLLFNGTYVNELWWSFCEVQMKIVPKVGLLPTGVSLPGCNQSAESDPFTLENLQLTDRSLCPFF